ncbi:uncharacterized protein LOC126897076 [Daktulosphaira vitifoliae]|uniref:uncharacterized protein LOC126897076 n=1 Tax=Daktulosphaira vitifoliae TaxID=58002 RepID=UPI0021A9D168|nr:uncharacterized protein LOC126897076 [Daktulosphaira vitifoliae]
MSRNQVYLVGAMNYQITGSKLPSVKNVLSVLYYNLRFVKLNLHESAALAVDGCLIYWKKARIPTQDPANIIRKLKKFYDELRNLEKNKTRTSDLYKKREQNFVDQIEELFDIAHVNAISLMKIQEDIDFLRLQRTKGRPGCMMGVDMSLTQAEKKMQIRQEQKNKILIPHSDTETLLEEKYSCTSSDSCDMEIVSEEERQFSPVAGPSKNKRGRKEHLTSRLSATLDRCKISDRDAVHLLTACLNALSLDPSIYVLNRSSIKRSREHYRQKIAENISSKFHEQNLNFVVIHWDSKMLPDLTGKKKVDRLPIIATALNFEQLLGVPYIPSGKGLEVSSAVYDALVKWSLLEKVQAFTFDTTASNTGRLNGACFLLEQRLGREILFLACRHHIYELVLQGVFSDTKLCPSTGPEILLFKRFQQEWETIDKTKFSTSISDTYVHNILKDEADEIILYAKSKITEYLPRDDYQEFLELVIIFLGGVPQRGNAFRKPGPYHLARWMAKAIYCLKIFLFKNQFKLDSREETSLKDICCFIVKCYVQAWFSSPKAIEAPFNDILFLRKLESYKLQNKKIADVALKKITNHLWYLNPECITFSLFDNRIDYNTKRKMAEKILSYNDDDDEETNLNKKLTLTPDDVPNFLQKDLPTDLITSKSIEMFKRFKIQTIFLSIDPAYWNYQEDFKTGREIIKSLKIVNDTAERGVKLMEEYNDKFTKDEEQKQFLLQTVQDYQKKYLKCDRETLKKIY